MTIAYVRYTEISLSRGDCESLRILGHESEKTSIQVVNDGEILIEISLSTTELDELVVALQGVRKDG